MKTSAIILGRRLVVGALAAIVFLSLAAAFAGLVSLLPILLKQYIPPQYEDEVLVLSAAAWVCFTVLALAGAFDQEEVA